MPAIEFESAEFRSEWENFARRLEQTAAIAFETETDVVQEYLESLNTLSPQARLLALHDSPLDVLATLTGIEPTKKIQETYDALFALPRTLLGEAGSFELIPNKIPRLTDEVLDRLGYLAIGETEDGIIVWTLIEEGPLISDRLRRFVGQPANADKSDLPLDQYEKVIADCLISGVPTQRERNAIRATITQVLFGWVNREETYRRDE